MPHEQPEVGWENKEKNNVSAVLETLVTQMKKEAKMQREQRERGVKFVAGYKHPETIALVADQVLNGLKDRRLALPLHIRQLMVNGIELLGTDFGDGKIPESGVILGAMQIDTFVNSFVEKEK